MSISSSSFDAHKMDGYPAVRNVMTKKVSWASTDSCDSRHHSGDARKETAGRESCARASGGFAREGSERSISSEAMMQLASNEDSDAEETTMKSEGDSSDASVLLEQELLG